MLNVGGAVHLSASDLVGHLNCRYLTSLDLAVANGMLAKLDHLPELQGRHYHKMKVPEFFELSPRRLDRKSSCI